MSGAEPFLVPLLLGAGTAAGSAVIASKAAGGSKGPAMPAPAEAKPLPTMDDEQRRKARLEAMAKAGATSGRQSTMLVRGKLGKDGEAETRSSVLSMG